MPLFADKCTEAFAGALIVARTEDGQSDRLDGTRKPRRVGANLGADQLDGHVTDAGDLAKQGDALANSLALFPGVVSSSER